MRAPGDVLAEHAPADPRPAAGARDLEPTLRDVRALVARPAALLPRPRPADHGVAARPAGAARDRCDGLEPLLGELDAVPRAAQPDPECLEYLPVPGRRLHRQRRGGARRHDAPTPSGGVGHYLRQFGPPGPRALAIYRERAATQPRQLLPRPLALTAPRAREVGIFPNYDCKPDRRREPAPPRTTPAAACGRRRGGLRPGRAGALPAHRRGGLPQPRPAAGRAELGGLRRCGGAASAKPVEHAVGEAAVAVDLEPARGRRRGRARAATRRCVPLTVAFGVAAALALGDLDAAAADRDEVVALGARPRRRRRARPRPSTPRAARAARGRGGRSRRCRRLARARRAPRPVVAPAARARR